MADPVSLALKAAVTAFDLCKATYSLIQGIKKAPDDIRRVASDLKGFYGILGALEHTVEDQKRHLTKPGPACYQLQNISALLDDCVAAFKELHERVQGFVAVNGKVIAGTWEGFKWDQFEKEDVQYLRSHLSNIKLSLNVALSSLTLLLVSRAGRQISRTHEEVIIVRRDLQQLRVQLEGSAQPHVLVNDAASIQDSLLSINSLTSLSSFETVASMEDSIRAFITNTEAIVDTAEVEGQAVGGASAEVATVGNFAVAMVVKPQAFAWPREQAPKRRSFDPFGWRGKSKPRRAHISLPEDTVHVTHVGYDYDENKYTGLPREWKRLMEAPEPGSAETTAAYYQCKKVVRALYDFTPLSDVSGTYLSFSAGDLLYVMSRADDSDWYEACDSHVMARGLAREILRG